ncbi:MAG: hypothetical protein KJN72_08115 [Woeseia sp.]|nr:hypothetical protein [Woeseia sp.]
MFPSKAQRTKTRISVARIVCGGVLMGLSINAYSQQWKFEPVLSLTAESNDNVGLAPDAPDEIDSLLFAVDANGRFVRRSQTGEVRIAPRIRSTVYEASGLDNTNDLFLDFFAGKNLERGRYGVQARISQESILTAELDDPDFDNPDVNQPVNLDTGRILPGIERDLFIISPYLSRELSETVGFNINLDYIDVAYDEDRLNLNDYTDATVYAGLSFQVSDRSSWSIEVLASDYEADDGMDRSESDSVGASVEFEHSFSPTVEGRISVGYEDVNSDDTTGSLTVSESYGVTLFSAGLTKEGEVSRLVLDAGQTVDPGGTGFMQERSQLRMRYTRQLSPTVYGNFDARVQRTDELSAQGTDISRDFLSFGVGAEWRLSRIWSFRGDYVFIDQEFDQAFGVGSASSNRVSVSIVYDPARAR